MTKKIVKLQNTEQVKSYNAVYTKGRSVQHVIKHQSGWVVKSSGSVRATKVFSTQSDAISVARNFAKKSGTAIVIHGKDGKIRDINRYSYKK